MVSSGASELIAETGADRYEHGESGPEPDGGKGQIVGAPVHHRVNPESDYDSLVGGT